MLKGLKAFDRKNAKNDILSGIIIALVSIPISMGYAQIAGLPAVYGLYGSVLPVILFAVFTSSPQYIFGVDAAPCAVVGGVLASLGITAASKEAMQIVPLLTFFTALWLLLFYVFKAGRLTEYVSTPVMGGFISGICATIILMQVPKLFGGTSGTGEIHRLVIHIAEQADESFNAASFVLGIVSIVLILLCKKYVAKFPMSVVIMLTSAAFQYFTDFCSRLGIHTLPAVEKGLGSFRMIDFSGLSVIKGMGLSLTVAVIIMAETVLAENSFANKNGYKINDNNEVATFAICNFAAAFTGCAPVNGSLSRTSMHEQFSGKSQVTSLVAAVSMIIILLFCTDFIQYLPIPVLTAIVICALLGAIEFSLARKLRKINKKEFYIFIAAFLGVLVFGTIYGVIIGVILSFVNVVIRESDPPRAFLGVVPGRSGFFNMQSNSQARPVKHAVIYRFKSNLFFANVKEFKEDIENAVKDDTRCVIVDASAMSGIDTTGADALEGIYKSLKKRGIQFILTEHISSVNDQLRQLGLGYIIEEGGVRRTITAALRSQGFEKPYELEFRNNDTVETIAPSFKDQLFHEFEWAFGSEAQNKIDAYTQEILDNVKNSATKNDSLSSLAHLWEGLGPFDEDILLESLELRLTELSKSTGIAEDELARKIESRREKIYQFVKSQDGEQFKKLRRHRHDVMHRLRDKSPELYHRLFNYHEEIVKARQERTEENQDDD